MFSPHPRIDGFLLLSLRPGLKAEIFQTLLNSPMTSKQGAKSMGYEIPAITYPDSQKTDLKTLNGLKEQQQEEETQANDLELRK